MKQPFRLILLTLLTCSLAASAGAAESAASKPAPVPTAPQAASAPLQKPSGPTSVQQHMRLGHVDIMRIGTESEAGKAGQAELAKLEKRLRASIEAKQKQLEKYKAGIEAKLPSLTPAQREAKSKEFQKKVEEYQKFGMEAKKEFEAKQEAFSDKLFKAVEQASAEVAKAKGLALVVIKRELLYLDNGVEAQDVTDDVIKKIDKK